MAEVVIVTISDRFPLFELNPQWQPEGLAHRHDLHKSRGHKAKLSLFPEWKNETKPEHTWKNKYLVRAYHTDIHIAEYWQSSSGTSRSPSTTLKHGRHSRNTYHNFSWHSGNTMAADSIYLTSKVYSTQRQAPSGPSPKPRPELVQSSPRRFPLQLLALVARLDHSQLHQPARVPPRFFR